MKKIILLTTVILLVLGAILFFVKTRLDPPFSIMPERQYEEKAQSYIDDINPRASMEALNKQFFQAAHAICYMSDSLLIDSEASDKLKENLCEKYVPAFADKCFEYFRRSSVWDSTEIKNFREQIGVVKLIVNSKGNRVVNNGTLLNDRLDSVFFVTKRNEEAMKLMKTRYFQSMEHSETVMDKVRSYQNHDYLRYNTSLCDSLSKVGKRLEDAHYNYLLDRVKQLKSPTTDDEKVFEEIYQKLLTDIDEYSMNASRVYGYHHDASYLRSKADDNYEDGLDEIRDDGSGWLFGW
ncbi:MAG: hypothetical protein IKX33_06620 [Prevotella sp.]|nr:hypothetical protein [Prevotella sp.]